jgi:hypothetical protein
LPSARQKTLGKEAFADPFFAVSSLPSATLGKVFAECLCCFAECVRHSTNEASPVVHAPAGMYVSSAQVLTTIIETAWKDQITRLNFDGLNGDCS